MTAKVSAAFVKAQAEIEKASKDKTNPHFRSKYADLGAVVDAIKPALEKHGLAFMQKFHENPDGVAVETIIIHESGESFSNGVLHVPATKRDAQGYGSAATYCRRYSLQAAFGVAPEDDDGNAASKKTDTKPDNRSRVIKPTDGAFDGRTAEEIATAKRVADAIKEHFANDNEYGAYEEYTGVEDNQVRVAIWALLASESKIRSTLKRMAAQEKEEAHV